LIGIRGEGAETAVRLKENTQTLGGALGVVGGTHSAVSVPATTRKVAAEGVNVKLSELRTKSELTPVLSVTRKMRKFKAALAGA
jgi:hypothetical protein